MKRLLIALGMVCGIACMASADQKVWLDEMDLELMSCSWKRPQRNKSVEGAPLRIFRTNMERGVGTHARSRIMVELSDAIAFDAQVGLDAEILNSGEGSVRFRVMSGKTVLADTGVLTKRKGPVPIHADLKGVKQAYLEVTDGGDGDNYDHADWGNAYFTVADGGKVKAIAQPETKQLGILTPRPPAEPRLVGPKVFGVRPGSPILFRFSATGVRPLTFSATGLPKGASLDEKTGILSGAVENVGAYQITVSAKNAKGTVSAPFTLQVGETIALTPPMGWNSWNCFASAVSAERIKSAALAMVESGLADHGFSYINIDDFWQNHEVGTKDETLKGPDRDAQGRIVSNKRFPDMKGLADYVHGLGLKIGLYSSPGPFTCGRCYGSWKHEMQDAQSYAEWGYDYLKYDWCSYGSVAKKEDSNLLYVMKPYTLMGKCLRAQKRDIVFSLCQYGMGSVSAWGDRVGGNTWRTTGDITDTYDSMRSLADRQDGLEVFVKPGNWNDPDMLVVGKVGWGHLHDSRLTRNEQYTHISLWCIFCSPLLIGCDMTQLDEFTLNLLTNDEVLETNQDPLGNAASRIYRDEEFEIWTKRMSDGSTVACLVNRSYEEVPAKFNFADAGLSGRFRLRDLWRQQDIGVSEDAYQTTLLAHACSLIRLFPVK
ncbi:MAG: NPCBM/NEW2 domain-containing protein [Kiritimatiellae bacterium]|nr:NPCBM/NEW2 domain-containing protein [Kiritimatiellia bacterium]